MKYAGITLAAFILEKALIPKKKFLNCMGLCLRSPKTLKYLKLETHFSGRVGPAGYRALNVNRQGQRGRPKGINSFIIKYYKFLRENMRERKKRKPSWESEYTREDTEY